MKKQVHFHSLRVLSKDFSHQFIQVVFLPEETQRFLSETLMKVDMEKDLRFSEFRSILLGRYSEVTIVDFSQQALDGRQPWLYLTENAAPHTGLLAHARFLNWVKRLLQSKKVDLDLSLLEHQKEMEQKRITVGDSLTFSSAKRVLNSWFIYQFVQASKKTIWKVPNKDGIDKELSFPEEWFYCYNGTEFEAVSAPILLAELKENGEPQYGSYVISLHFVEVEQSYEYEMYVKTSLRRWIYNPLFKDGKYFFPRNHKRSLYLIKSDAGQRKMIRFPMNKFKNKVYLSFYNQTVEMFEELGFTPNLPVILANPGNFYFSEPLAALIPYKTDDKNYPNVIEAGISRNEKMLLYQMFIERFPYLANAHPEVRLISTPRTTLKGGSLSLEHPLRSYRNDMIIELFSKNEELPKILEEALFLFVKELKGYETRFQLVKFDERHYQIIDVTSTFVFNLTFVDRSDALSVTQDLEAVNGKKSAAERKRIKEIKQTLSDQGKLIYSLIEIHSYAYNPDSDPKQAIEKGFVEVNRLTQCFHPIEKLKHKEQVQIMKSCLADIFTRKGFVNQMITVYQELLSRKTYYFPLNLPVVIAKNKGHLYVMSRMKNGEIHVKYKDTEWMSIEESLVYLTENNKRNLFQVGDHDFISFIEEIAKDKHDVVAFQKLELPQYYSDLDDDDFPYTLAIFDGAFDRNPYIENISDGVPSTGTFIVESKGEYYAVPPKLPDPKGKNILTKQDINKVFQIRHPLRMNISTLDDDVAISLYLMCNLSITFNTFLNHPLPYHLLRHHRKLL